MTAAERIEEIEEEVIRLARLTPPQSAFYQAEEKFPLFVGGFGSGKSTTMSVCATTDVVNFDDADIACYAPTYDLLKRVTEPMLAERLEIAGLRYHLNKSDHIFFISDPGIGDVICRSMTNPERIIGYEVFRSHVDELDTLKPEMAETAWNQIIARNRQKIYQRDANGDRILRDQAAYEADVAQARPGEFVDPYETELNRVSAYTTPEGFKFAHKRWVREANELYGIYRVSTYSNPYLPPDYIGSLLATYPEQLIRAYLLGHFVNLTSGAVYGHFDRDKNRSTLTMADVQPNEPVHIGMDFNVVYGASVAHVIRNEEPHAIAEVHDAHDTEAQVVAWDERFPNNPIFVYPDATGKKRSSSNSSPTKTDIAMLEQAGWQLQNDYSNPLIRDRVNCMNAMFLNGEQDRRYFVNPDTCPNYTEGLEQIVWDDNGVPDKTSGFDHITEAGGYFIAKRFPIIRKTAGFGGFGRTRR